MNTLHFVTTRLSSPSSSVRLLPDAIVRQIREIASLFFDSNALDFGRTAVHTRFRTVRTMFKNPFLIPFGAVMVIVLIAIFIALRNLDTSSSTGSTDGKIRIQDAKATQVLNKQFTFPLKDTAGKEVSRLRFVVENVEIKDGIIVKGKRATSVAGRTFLIVNVKITNDYTKSIEINVRDYTRLIAGKSNERLAPDIHNDPVEVQALSTKYTRVGFPIDEKEKILTLQVGEITGKKELVALKLQ